MLPISIHNMDGRNALIDLCASLNVIPISIVKKICDLQIEEIKTTMQMTNKT